MDTQIRDQLACQRTELANERTLLAYVRTALGFVIVGVPARVVGGLSIHSSVGWAVVRGRSRVPRARYATVHDG
ncbi:MAG: DUF202 domain-containing protein [Nitrospira sp.]|nr:MAG: DUF202 domain-containing protein [Nitrospira sp.]